MIDKKRNLLHLELLRVIAIFLVLFNHTGTNGFSFYSVAEGSVLYPLYLFMSIACKVAVPLFFMISGALLLGKEESIKDVYKKRVLRIVIVLVAVSIVYLIYDSLRNGATFTLSSFLTTLYSSEMSIALWFLWAYLAVLLMLPLLRRLAKGMNLHEYAYLAIMSIIFVGVIPLLQYGLGQNTVTINSNLNVALFTSTCMVFFLMGYFFEHVLPEKYYTWKNACIGIVASLVAIGICCFMTWYWAGVTGDDGPSEVFHNMLIAVPTYTVYFCAKLWFKNRKVPQKAGQFLQLAGGTTFGIFLLEGILRPETKPIFTFLEPYIHTMPACLIWILVAVNVGFGVTLLLKLIPGVKKYI